MAWVYNRFMVQRLAVPLLFLVITTLFCSCSKEVLDAAYENLDRRADMVLCDSSYLMGDDTMSPIRLSGSLLSFYRSDSRVEIEGASFEQDDGNGSLATSGSCNLAIVDTVSRNVTLKGDVEILRPADSLEIRTQTAIWNNDEHHVSCPGEVAVRFEGNEIKGSGFEGDFDKGIFTLASVEQGRVDL